MQLPFRSAHSKTFRNKIHQVNAYVGWVFLLVFFWLGFFCCCCSCTPLLPYLLNSYALFLKISLVFFTTRLVTILVTALPTFI